MLLSQNTSLYYTFITRIAIYHIFLFSVGADVFVDLDVSCGIPILKNGSNELQMRIVVEQYEYTSLNDEVTSIG